MLDRPVSTRYTRTEEQGGDVKQGNKSAETRLLAAVAHGSFVAQGLGILVGVLIYVTQQH